MAAPVTILQTARLVLRQLVEDDAPFILRLLNEPSWLKYIGDKGVRSLDDARAYIENVPRAMYQRYGFGLYLVSLRDSVTPATPIGLCGLLRRDGLDDVDIGFAFLPEYWAQGYAFEAAQATLRYAHETLRLGRIVAITSPDNVGSGRLLEKLGLRAEGLIRLTPNAPEVRLYGEPPGA